MSKGATAAVMVLVGALLLGVFVGPTIVWRSIKAEVTCTVDDKDRTVKSDGSSQQRLYSDCGVFVIEDDWLSGQWNSADLYSQIKPGTTYELRTVGWRNGFFSQFPNVLEASKVTR